MVGSLGMSPSQRANFPALSRLMEEAAEEARSAERAQRERDRSGAALTRASDYYREA